MSDETRAPSEPCGLQDQKLEHPRRSGQFVNYRPEDLSPQLRERRTKLCKRNKGLDDPEAQLEVMRKGISESDPSINNLKETLDGLLTRLRDQMEQWPEWDTAGKLLLGEYDELMSDREKITDSQDMLQRGYGEIEESGGDTSDEAKREYNAKLREKDNLLAVVFEDINRYHDNVNILLGRMRLHLEDESAWASRDSRDWRWRADMLGAICSCEQNWKDLAPYNADVSDYYAKKRSFGERLDRYQEDRMKWKYEAWEYIAKRRSHFFVSYASEDRDNVAQPLVEALRADGYTVWYDESSLQVGDEHLATIQAGLQKCKYGIVVLSPNYMIKKWTNHEREALVRRAKEGGLTIMPIWHEVAEQDVTEYDEFLSRIAAERTNRHSIREIAARMVQAIGETVEEDMR